MKSFSWPINTAKYNYLFWWLCLLPWIFHEKWSILFEFMTCSSCEKIHLWAMNFPWILLQCISWPPLNFKQRDFHGPWQRFVLWPLISWAVTVIFRELWLPPIPTPLEIGVMRLHIQFVILKFLSFLLFFLD